MDVSEKIPDAITLHFREGGSDKQYHATLVARGGGYLVNFEYGRRGGAQTTGSKTPKPVPCAEARQIYERLVREKLAKGYVPEETSMRRAPAADRSRRDATSSAARKSPTRKAERSMPALAPPPQLPFDFSLTFTEYDSDEVVAELISPLLDHALHPSGKARVLIETMAGTKKGEPHFVLDAFHLNSLLEYLRGQRVVRSTLKAELPRDRENWERNAGEDNTGGGDAWAGVQLRELRLRRKESISPEFLANLKKDFTPKELKEELAGWDRPDTKSFFTVVLDCEWDEEHSVQARFRDGAFVELDHE